MLREYRRTHQVPMVELRAFMYLLRGGLGVPLSLDDRRPYVVNRELVLEAQEAGRDADLCLVAPVRGQLILTAPSESFVSRVTWEDDTPTTWRPHDDPGSPVRVDPGVRFGKPAIEGISTEALWEHSKAGEDDDENAEAFGLPLDDVSWALAYENTARVA